MTESITVQTGICPGARRLLVVAALGLWAAPGQVRADPAAGWAVSAEYISARRAFGDSGARYSWLHETKQNGIGLSLSAERPLGFVTAGGGLTYVWYPGVNDPFQIMLNGQVVRTWAQVAYPWRRTSRFTGDLVVGPGYTWVRGNALVNGATQPISASGPNLTLGLRGLIHLSSRWSIASRLQVLTEFVPFGYGTASTWGRFGDKSLHEFGWDITLGVQARL